MVWLGNPRKIKCEAQISLKIQHKSAQHRLENLQRNEVQRLKKIKYFEEKLTENIAKPKEL